MIRNGSNIVLKAPRRIGKSSLIKHVFGQNAVSRHYNTLYVDIYDTKNASDFHAEFQNTLLHAPFAKSRLNNTKERNTLFCIAMEGIADGLTSSSIMKKYKLDNASAVQNALENLGQDKLALIEKIAKGKYVLQDRLFELWIASKNGVLEEKYENAEKRFHIQREIASRITGLKD